MKYLFMLLSLSAGAYAVRTTAEWMDAATAVIADATAQR